MSTSKKMPCRACCPPNDRYPQVGRVTHTLDFNDDMRKGWRCTNCYDFKLARNRKALSWDDISKTVTTDKGMNVKQRAQFHYFNPHGAYKSLLVVQEQVNAFVDAHPEIPNGVCFVHGTLNDYGYTLISKLAMASAPKSWDVAYAVQWMNKAQIAAQVWLAEKRAALVENEQ
jgi:hypothetical protein